MLTLHTLPGVLSPPYSRARCAVPGPVDDPARFGGEPPGIIRAG